MVAVLGLNAAVWKTLPPKWRGVWGATVTLVEGYALVDSYQRRYWCAGEGDKPPYL